ncbi:Phenylacetic acid catabolic protein [Sulfitobacter sp. S190]|uniref:Phenylacetic acid catabolic protein n=1 Tax=Sulfitobacter sp. S190 TaxID=2867022 RepID=UPI0021A5BD48|nr:Phenylacetic acid catabolic protein [Sulfitobacter sp. S190]UWR20967.1 phenylacetate-CoA oxygenase subunit PaaI [Sulfitobacter sp. S190]
MSDTMSTDAYLARGGRLTTPENVPPRYRAELLRLMAIFVDSQLAGAAGFATRINAGPGVTERIAAARIVLEKNHHAAQVLKIMAEFGVDTTRYFQHHPWDDRLPREAPIGAARMHSDMRLPVFNAPLGDWADAITMNLLTGLAANTLLIDYRGMSYQPLAEAFRDIEPVERRHTELAAEGLAVLHKEGAALQTAVDYWWPRVRAGFGGADTGRDDRLRRFGLRRATNAELCDQWIDAARQALAPFHLHAPKT